MKNTTAEQMAKTFPYILTSGVLQRKVAAQMGTGGFSGSVRATVEENTNLFYSFRDGFGPPESL